VERPRTWVVPTAALIARYERQRIVNYPPKGGFMESVLLDVAGHRRSPATVPGYHL
jgi:hypothetical protein